MSESLSSRHKKNTLGFYISSREIFVSTRSRALIGSPTVEKTPWTPKGKKIRRLEITNLNTEKLKTKPVIWKKLLGTECKWTLRDDLWIQPIHIHHFEVLFRLWHSASLSGKSRKTCRLTLNKNNRFWMPSSLKQRWNCEKAEIPQFSFLWEVFCPPCSK
jgi:hypothetical protein